MLLVTYTARSTMNDVMKNSSHALETPLEDVPDVGVGASRIVHSPPQRKVSNIDEPMVKTGIIGSSSNLVNAIVGAGIIGLPYAIRESGFIVGFFLIILVGVFTDKSLRLIVNLATFHPKLKDLGVLTYEDLMSIPFGRWGRIFILVSMLILAYGAMVAYLLIIKDNVPDLLGLGDSFAERELVMFVTSLLIMLPLSMLRDISQLAFTSFLSITADAVLVVIVAIYAPVGQSVADAGGLGQVLADNWINANLFVGLGVLSTAMACQHSSFLISNTLENHTSRRWAQVTGLSLVAATAMSLALGVFGYLGFLDQTKGDVLKNFGQAGSLVSASRALLSVTMFFTYPMESFVARHVVVQLLYNGNMDNNSLGPNGEVVPERKLLGLLGRRELWTIYLYGAALIPALIVDDLGPVLSLTGSLGASSIAYIAPGLIYLGLNGDDFLAWTARHVQSRNHKHGSENSEIELPMVGDSKATLKMAAEPTYPEGSKPLWWWFAGMPLWVAIANTGANGTTSFMSDIGYDVGRPLRGPSDDGDEVIGPRKSDYIYSIVFIVFGVIAAVAGVVSNIFVQVNNIFFTPR